MLLARELRFENRRGVGPHSASTVCTFIYSQSLGHREERNTQTLHSEGPRPALLLQDPTTLRGDLCCKSPP